MTRSSSGASAMRSLRSWPAFMSARRRAPTLRSALRRNRRTAPQVPPARDAPGSRAAAAPPPPRSVAALGNAECGSRGIARRAFLRGAHDDGLSMRAHLPVGFKRIGGNKAPDQHVDHSRNGWSVPQEGLIILATWTGFAFAVDQRRARTPPSSRASPGARMADLIDIMEVSTKVLDKLCDAD